MRATRLRHSDLPGTSKLFADVLYDSVKTSRFYASTPPDSGYPDSRRAALSAALGPLNEGAPALALLARPGTMAVITGQQVGLFGGPAYTVYKALTAVKLARRLSERGTPAVPVFWAATEDHDFEEIRHFWTFNAAQEPLRLSVPADTSQRPAGQIAPEAYPVKEFAESLAGLPFAEDALRHVAAAYTPGATMGAAFIALLKSLLAPYGLLFLDPMEPAIRSLAAPFLRDAVASGPELVRLLLERNAELSGAGYHAQVHVEADSSLFFTLAGGRRVSLRNGEPVPAPELISPNALLRPLMQDYLLPTAAYVGGPAEVAYLAQSQVLYQALGLRQPEARARAFFTILDRRAEKLMARYELALPEILVGEEQFKQRLATRLVPPELAAHFGRIGGLFEERLAELRAEVLAFDPTLAAALDKARAKMLYQLAKTERKLKRESVRRDATAGRDAVYLRNLIYPHEHLQERLYGFLPLVAKHGPGLFEQVYENLTPDSPDHVVLTA